ncbi:hypothetical protein H8356DRAFT_1747752 [Neocallimastix lanati (nom. inval.)]|jgi:hypothetical protein|uniref:Peptidase C14 caspase domain-containing protein n=1 Tax=Neocallimastix californiae TaxID=1754190 RepID=A0A1Y1ZZ18_9FUNG|nr:hypothetical protein H8356DRAFT_1747752 [Neocallimastix sp. JGI-2020a]ORY15523.1 hypothetical protein LY90DRAFT_708483 [Neocallimastix californiae]|eukprot:ORY15523.1 hypothetical protein LY90DRAFT_708483 [Neocallimastix californiae]
MSYPGGKGGRTANGYYSNNKNKSNSDSNSSANSSNNPPFPPQGFNQGGFNPYGMNNQYGPGGGGYNQGPGGYNQGPSNAPYPPYGPPNGGFGGYGPGPYGPPPPPFGRPPPPFGGPPPPYGPAPGFGYSSGPYGLQQAYSGPGDPYLATPYNGNGPQGPPQSQPYNMPAPNSAPVFYQPPKEYFQQHKISDCRGNKKALLIGINYIGQQYQLSGCINDVKCIRQLITEKFGFVDRPDKMVVLTDDQKDPLKIPTRKNMLNAMRWLVQGCKPGDSLFFHFSGHGSQKKDEDGDEVDGYDETILPVDYKKSGQIVDDEMNAIMVRPLPEGVRLTAIFDSCHSGTALDLPYVYADDGSLVVQKGPSGMKILNETINNLATGNVLGLIGNLMDFTESDKIKKNSANAKKKTEQTKSTFADVIMFSGCKDSQTSADTKINNTSTGAMSYAFIKAISTSNNLTYLQLLQKTKGILREKYSQKPQLSSGRLMDMNQVFFM